jgi:hypothetical protein
MFSKRREARKSLDVRPEETVAMRADAYFPPSRCAVSWQGGYEWVDEDPDVLIQRWVHALGLGLLILTATPYDGKGRKVVVRADLITHIEDRTAEYEAALLRKRIEDGAIEVQTDPTVYHP